MRSFALVLAGAALALAVSCGSNVVLPSSNGATTTGGGAPGTGGTASGTGGTASGTGGGMVHTPCQTSADCPPGDGCYPPSELPLCDISLPSTNQCLGDMCQVDADCAAYHAPAICAPAGAWGNVQKECFTAFCQTDADCTAEPGGNCGLIGYNPCCGPQIPDGIGCVYPGDCAACTGGGCRLDPSTGRGACEPTPPCPPPCPPPPPP